MWFYLRAYHLIICGLVLITLFVICFPYWPELEHAMLPRAIQRVVGRPAWACGDSGCAKILVRAYPVALSASDRAAGITERWCVSYTRVRSHTGRMARNFRWAYQTGQRVRHVVEKQAGGYQATIAEENDPDAFHAACPL